MKTVYALVDCNSFYCSCERVFSPKAQGKPTVALSNNDGCIISLTSEAKELGINMAEPYWKIRDALEAKKVHVFSSNYALYADMSNRVMSILSTFTPQLEVYSIDEAFLNFTHLPELDFYQYGEIIRQRIKQYLGLPVCVGIGSTKVLAKVANHLAKSSQVGTKVLLDKKIIEHELENFPIRKVWGIGWQSAKKMDRIGIKTAKDLCNFRNEKLIQSLFTKTGRQIQDELRGTSCLEVRDIRVKKNILVSRSFAKGVFNEEQLVQAVSIHTAEAAKRLRKQQSLCSLLSVFINTNSAKDIPQYSDSKSVSFITPTQDTIELIKAAQKLVKKMYRPGFEYKQTGIYLSDFCSENNIQKDFFSHENQQTIKVSHLMDSVTLRFGKKALYSGSCGKLAPMELPNQFKSKSCTTRWDELIKVS